MTQAATITRQPHWDTRGLHAFLLARATAPFVWGANDCALFAADAIEAMTGVDIAADFRGSDGRGKYHDEASAFALIHSVTGGTTVADAAAHCAAQHGLVEWLLPHSPGTVPVPGPLLARRGDLVVLPDAGRLIAGVVHPNGRDVAVVGEAGLKRIPVTTVTRAWHVPSGGH
jgi:hypothetical protein